MFLFCFNFIRYEPYHYASSNKAAEKQGNVYMIYNNKNLLQYILNNV